MKYYTVEKIEKLIEYDEQKLNQKILFENKNDKAILFALKKNQILKTHTSPVDAFIIVIEGEILFNIKEVNHTISKGESLFFKKEEKHTVLAQSDSKFIVIRIGT